MWRLKDTPADMEVFRQAVRALRNELSLRRGLVLRVYPIAYRGKDEVIKQVLAEEGYRYHDDGTNHRTLIIDLEPSLEEIRAVLDPKWRNHLNRAEKNSLELIVGEEEGLFEEIKKIYMEMVRRKGLVELSDIDHLKRVQRDLPPALKLKVILCRLNGVLIAGAIFSAVGATAEYLVGATSDAGMKAKGSYLIQWAFVKWIKERGFRYYDLTGINPYTNPGTYSFKRGLAGKHGMDVEFLGKFQVADSRVSSFVVKGGELIMSGYKKIMRVGRSLRNASNKELPEK
jgi:lipid II:glycine glycyltransferase (peptidoglycan interpeptide bridge formation enzyme)